MYGATHYYVIATDHVYAKLAELHEEVRPSQASWQFTMLSDESIARPTH